MEAFWCITIGYILIKRKWNKYMEKKKIEDEIRERFKPAPPPDPEKIREFDRKREIDSQIADLKKQGYTDELIAVIIPTINNGK